MTDLIFLKALRDKLKGGNIRSIHLNALPGRYASRLDIGTLNYIQPQFAEKFLELLFTKSCFEFKISFDGIDLNSISNEEQKRLGLLSKRLNSLYIENEDNYKEHGIKTFSFGYPLLIKPSKQDPTKIIKAPLFIWPLEIIKSFNKVNTWSILRNKTRNENGKILDEEIHSVGLNEVLLSFLKTDEGITIPQVNEDLLEDAVIDRDELVEECCKVLEKLNSSADKNVLLSKLNEQVKNIPESSSIESTVSNKTWIYFGGVFGLFRTQKESIITDIDKLIENYGDFKFDGLEVEGFGGTSHSAVETDPSQQAILNTLGLDPKKIIQGPPGTGKSQSLTALITNALANNLKCLVVCEKKTALEVIKNNLHREHDQLGALTAVIEDINKDRDGIVNSVRDRINSIGQTVAFNQANYHAARQTIETTATTLNGHHRELDKKIFQGKSWTELVGQYLRRQKKADHTLLKNKLDYKSFKFEKDENELSDIVAKIRTARKLYSEINRLDHPLEILSDEIFKQDNPRGISLRLEELSTQLTLNIEKLKADLENECLIYNHWLDKHYSETTKNLEQLNANIEQDILEYQNWLDAHYSDYYQSIKNQLKNYLSFVNANQERFGEVFFKNDGITRFKTEVLGIFSEKHKALKNNRLAIVNQIDEIKKVHHSFKYFEHQYIETDHKPTLKVYVDNVNILNNLVDEWYKSTEETKQNYLNRFSSISVHPKYAEKKKRIKDTEENFEKIISQLKNDEQLAIDSTPNEFHKNKADVIKKLLQRLINLSGIKQFYTDRFSSDSLHSGYSENKNNIITKENSYEQIISGLKNEKLLGRQFQQHKGYNAKIEETANLVSELKTISDNLDGFREYYDWRKFYIELPQLYKDVVKAVIECNCQDWETTFECWYYYWLLSINEHKDLPKSGDIIDELYNAKDQLKKTQIKSIINNWCVRQLHTIKKAQLEGVNPIGLFNKRGSRGERRNSLRKIVKTDFQLFTDFFPVVMVSPTVCSSIIPLQEGLFDVIIFDEASQLRLEDTFPALIRGKIKIVSGDSQQMPPSSYFQGGSSLLNPGDEDFDEEATNPEAQSRKINNSIDLADSESLLVYAENCNYKQSYLKIHYRSQHPHLIDFSNHAFYGKRLIPMPAKKEYKPIKFVEVNGLYEDQVNRDEARQVVDILLNHIKPFRNGKYPSVGVATFNLYQRNLILEEITKARQIKPEYDKKISDLGSDLFVKNLENIQGDERDIIIISTTFGRKTDGSFRQHFGPVLQRNGYKLLNVIVTRAKYKIFVCSSIPQEHIMQYSGLLQQSKNTGRGIFYAYLAYAKSVSDGNNEAKDILLRQLYENCESKTFDIEFDTDGSESPFEEEVYYLLASKIGQHRLQQQYKIGGFRIDLVIKSENSGRPLIAIECDGAKYHNSSEAYAWDMFRQKQIEQYGFKFYRIWSTNWFYSHEKELKRLVSFIQNIDKEERQETADVFEAFYQEEEIISITSKSGTKKKIGFGSIITVKDPEGKIVKVKFSKNQTTNDKPDNKGINSIYEGSPLALALTGKTEGETCQLGMLEVYYEILKIE